MNNNNKKYNAVPIPKPGQERLPKGSRSTHEFDLPNYSMDSDFDTPNHSSDSDSVTPGRSSVQDSNPQNSNLQPLRQSGMSSETFYEIEYDSGPFPGVGRYVLKSQKIEPPERDEIRELFQQMREIAREERFLNYNSSRFYDKKVQQENARIFYKQGLFMKDFEDHYEKIVPFSSYFPDYQMMGYEQLRTYFTWRTKVRRGEVTEASLSYVFLYLYELLNNIGVESPEDGLNKLMSFWNVSRTYYQAVDKYVLKWLKDYHIYYELPWSFKEFIIENGLGAHYPNIWNPNDNFDSLCSISKYDIRKSGFYNDDTVGLIRDCLDFVIHRLREAFSENGILLDNFLFQPPKNMTPWTPFRDALFYSGVKKTDRQVVLSEKEIYICRQNKWLFHSTITTESGKQLIGYVLKQMESELRKAVKYKYKLSANVNALGSITADVLRQANISLERLVTDAVWEFYREITKTVVKVDPNALDRIRQEALITQEKLIVPEEESTFAGSTNLTSSVTHNAKTTVPFTDNTELTSLSVDNKALTASSVDTAELTAPSLSRQEPKSYITTTQDGQLELNPEMLTAWAPEKSSAAETVTALEDAVMNPWQSFLDALNDMEKQALFILWREQTGSAEFFEEEPASTAAGNRTAAGCGQPDSESAMEITELLTSNIKQFAQKHNIMLEVLMDGINEKAMDYIGDSLLDGEFAIYEDYTEQIEGMVKHIWQDKYPQESPIS